MNAQPIGFLSYVRDDDEHEQRRLTEIGKSLSGEVRMQSGELFPIFQDKTNIDWGQQWIERIEESLDDVTFLIPIITPGFFKSDVCRSELMRFLDRERKLERNDLILPVYYIDCPILNDKAKREDDPLAETIAARQYSDWRDLRFELLTAPKVRKMLEKMAAQILHALERGQPKRKHKNARQSPGRAGGRFKVNRSKSIKIT